MSLNMNNTFLFMNWFADHHFSSINSIDDLRSSLTPQLWDDFINSDFLITNTHSLVHSIKNKAIRSLNNYPRPNKKNAKSLNGTQVNDPDGAPTQDTPAEAPPAPVEEGVAPTPKKSRVKKPVVTKSSDPDGSLQDTPTLDTPVEAPPAPVPKKSRVKKPVTKPSDTVNDTINDTVGYPIETVIDKKSKKPRVNHSKSNLSTKEPDDTLVIGLPNHDFHEIQLQLIHVNGQDAFIDDAHNVFTF